MVAPLVGAAARVAGKQILKQAIKQGKKGRISPGPSIGGIKNFVKGKEKEITSATVSKVESEVGKPAIRTNATSLYKRTKRLASAHVTKQSVKEGAKEKSKQIAREFASNAVQDQFGSAGSLVNRLADRTIYTGADNISKQLNAMKRRNESKTRLQQFTEKYGANWHGGSEGYAKNVVFQQATKQYWVGKDGDRLENIINGYAKKHGVNPDVIDIDAMYNDIIEQNIDVVNSIQDSVWYMDLDTSDPTFQKAYRDYRSQETSPIDLAKVVPYM